MSFEFCVLGSGSSGNSVAFWDSETMFLVDAGFSCRETARRMGQAGLDPENLQAIFISHEHTDHISGASVIQKRFGPRILTTPPVGGWLDAKLGLATEPILIADETEELGRFSITPFGVSHDASFTVGFIIEKGKRKVAMATDLGHTTPDLEGKFAGSDAVILESNHDVQMLKEGPYPAFLKKRILGKQGHLSNAQSSEMLVKVVGSRTKHVTLAHISRENNTSEKAFEEASNALGNGRKPEIAPASQFEICNIIKIG
jgi:phosphoribosyl 1,2-cyclic phosphodiesterase